MLSTTKERGVVHRDTELPEPRDKFTPRRLQKARLSHFQRNTVETILKENIEKMDFNPLATMMVPAYIYLRQP